MRIAAIRPIVSEHEVLTGWHYLRCHAVVRSLPNVSLSLRNTVQVNTSASDLDGVAAHGDDPLDEHRLGLDRITKHDDFATLRVAPKKSGAGMVGREKPADECVVNPKMGGPIHD